MNQASEADIAVLKNVVTRIDTAISNMAEVSNNIGKLLAVHESRLDHIEKTNNEVSFDVRELHSRITTMSKEILSKLDETEDHFYLMLKEVTTTTKVQVDEIKKDFDQLERRVLFVEKWKYYVIGAAIALGWALSRLPITTNLL